MAKTENLQSLFESKEAYLLANLKAPLSHPTTKGDQAEQNWIKFLRSFLPSKYGITKGFVIDHQGQISEQLDIIIYDALYSPLIFETGADERYITAESVYAIFESKPVINAGNIKYAAEKVDSVLRLPRTSRSMINAGKKVPPRKQAPIIGGILANSSIKDKYLRKALTDNRNLQIGFAAIDKTMFTKGYSGNLKVFENNDRAILAFFFALLDMLHEIGTVPCIDIRKYAHEISPLFDELFGGE